MQKKVTYILSNINKALAFEWIVAELIKEKFGLHFILLNPGASQLESYLKEHNLPADRITYTGKKDLPKAIATIYQLLKKQKPDVVHTHLFDANIAGLSAAWLARVPKRIYTRHHSDYHHIYYPKAVKYDKIVNRLATHIIAISKVVEHVLITKEHVPAKKISIIHHGFQLDAFKNIPAAATEKLKQKYNPGHASPVIGVISRYIELKGIQYIIPAFKKLREAYPGALLVLANTQGEYRAQIKKLLEELPAGSYIEIPFEADIFTLYQLFDVFVHVPVSATCEAFGQTYVEALAAKVPSVFTLSGIANDFIRDRHNVLVLPYRDADAIAAAMKELLADNVLAERLSANGEKDVTSTFGLSRMIGSLEQLYAG